MSVKVDDGREQHSSRLSCYSIGRNLVPTTLEKSSDSTNRNVRNFGRIYKAIESENEEELAWLFAWVKEDLSIYRHRLNLVLHERLLAKPELLKRVRESLCEELETLSFPRFVYVVDLLQTFLVGNPNPKWFPGLS